MGDMKYNWGLSNYNIEYIAQHYDWINHSDWDFDPEQVGLKISETRNVMRPDTAYNRLCYWYHTANVVEKITANLYLIVYISICILGASFEWQLVFDALRHLVSK